MSFIASWISNIIIFVLLATILDMLLPNSPMQKYTKMVVGLLLIAIIITPIFKLFQTDFDEMLAMATSGMNEDGGQKDLENLTESKKKEIQAAQGAYILEQMAVQMKSQVEEELMEKYQVAIGDIQIEVKNDEAPKIPEELQKITLTLEPASQADGAKNDEEAVETIAEVQIGTETEAQTKPLQDSEQVEKFLAAQWSVEKGMIEIAGERSD
ncbi:stage III sporulation protein AF [Bacillus massiliglaciei]|uniref:stage III sporulation protein AF n=1 Tax=Bacillus massiliglaciei TaxID=1816693 RepID=UPI000DA610FB|nr:stage III sporulation protein AF [Bacillus massiliglaciei]